MEFGDRVVVLLHWVHHHKKIVKIVNNCKEKLGARCAKVSLGQDVLQNFVLKAQDLYGSLLFLGKSACFSFHLFYTLNPVLASAYYKIYYPSSWSLVAFFICFYSTTTTDVDHSILSVAMKY